MITTKYYTNKNFPIPFERIFEKLLNLEEKLNGQSVKIKSIFNKSDKNPSMIIFLSDENIYRFKDFSSGLYGDAIDIVQYLYNISDRQDAFKKVLEIFKDENYSITSNLDIIKTVKKVSSYKIRLFNNLDAAYWKSYNISGSFLKKYFIKPLEEYTIEISHNDIVSQYYFNPKLCYGYFNKQGELCKIYNPNNSKAKFIKVNEFIQGEDQLSYNKKCLIIASSMKDIGAFLSLGFSNIELIAPDSENTKIPPEKIEHYKSIYQYIFTMFDNDLPGMKAMSDYKKLYDIPYIYFTIEKDIADAVKIHGTENIKLFIKPILQNAIRNQNQKFIGK